MRHRRFISSSAAAYAILTLLGLFFILPFLWVISASLTPNATFDTSFPSHPTLNNFRSIIDQGYVTKPFTNSLILGISTMVLTVALSGLAGYPLSRYQFRFKRPLMYVILFASGLPILALVTPLYAMYVSLNLIDTVEGVILFLVGSALPFNIWLMKNFLDSVPVELEEAAWVDGLSVFGAFMRVVLPLCAPGIAVAGILSFLGAYTNFFVPFIIYTSADHFPASVQLFSFFGSYGQVNYGQIAAFAMFYALPAVVLYMIVSRFLVRGINVGGIRGVIAVRRLVILTAWVALAWPAASVPSARSASPCAPTMRTLASLPGRIDTLLAAQSGLLIALTGRPASAIRFLPHDDLLLLTLPDGTLRGRITLPPYIAAPGLTVVSGRGTPVAVVIDATLLLLDGHDGHLLARQTLDMTALGWPAAVAAGPAGQLYVAGQPANARAARVDALAYGSTRRLRERWQAPLGLTHAGIWLGLAGSDLLAAYLPDAFDQQGTIALFDTRTGTLRGSYAVPAPPLTADSRRNLLYLASGGRIEVRSLRGGKLVASAPGGVPLALDLPRGLVAYEQEGVLALADSRTLHPLNRLPLGGATALTFTPDGRRMVAGQGTRLVEATLGRCQGA